ncbi:MAG TPA: ROK family protein, partial [Herpetosiphonaceae bacterium]|nr:ROK family protein [Herpetosiphonaceae bacterium]
QQERHRLPTPQPSTPAAVAETVAELARHFAWQGPIGCTFPAIVKDGVALSAANVDAGWIGADAAALFSAATGDAVTVLNDADAAGIAEMRFGAGKGQLGVVMVLTFGTGIGSALFYRGMLVPNTELGHLEIRGKDAEHRASASVREQKGWDWPEWSKRVDEYLRHLELLFSPDLFIVGGGVSKKFDKFAPFLHTRAPIVAAALLNNAGLVGAAMAAASQ